MGEKVYLVSDNEKYRAEYIRRKMGLQNRFDDLFFSCDLQHKKSEVEFFQTVLIRLNTKPSEVAYWDDDPKNVEVARGLGLQANLYSTFEEFSQKTNQLISS